MDQVGHRAGRPRGQPAGTAGRQPRRPAPNCRGRVPGRRPGRIRRRHRPDRSRRSHARLPDEVGPLVATACNAFTQPDPPDTTAADRDAPDAAIDPDDPAWADLAPGGLDWGGHLSPQAVRRLLCDAAVSRIVLAGTAMPMDIGRTSRSWPQPQRRAINARDRRCRGPNCTRPIAWTAVHHVRWWRNNGVTAVDNGIALCHHCHALVNEQG